MRQEIVGKGNLSIVIAPHSHTALAAWWARPLVSEQWLQTTSQLKPGVNEKGIPTVSWRIKSLLVLLILTMTTTCQTAALNASPAVSAGALTTEYQRSSADVRSKYDGKEIVVRGYAPLASRVPQPGDDQGSVFLKEKGNDSALELTCWFSKHQTQEFSKIKGEQYITVKGIFNGEAGVDLKFCQLLRIE